MHGTTDSVEPSHHLFDILGSRLELGPEALDRLHSSVSEHAGRLPVNERANLAELLYADLFSEYDARYLSDHLRALGFGRHFLACERHWARDEELHYLGFRSIYSALSGRAEAELDEELARRRHDVDFAPISALFADEFKTACLMAYDELATVRAYRKCAASYSRLGPVGEVFVQEVTADEGRHFRNFLKLLREEHADRFGEVPAVVERIRATEGVVYRNTFVLDHDDDVWDEAIFDDAALVLRRRLAR